MSNYRPTETTKDAAVCDADEYWKQRQADLANAHPQTTSSPTGEGPEQLNQRKCGGDGLFSGTNSTKRRELSEPATKELINMVACYRQILDADPTVGAAFEYVAEVLRRLHAKAN